MILSLRDLRLGFAITMHFVPGSLCTLRPCCFTILPALAFAMPSGLDL